MQSCFIILGTVFRSTGTSLAPVDFSFGDSKETAKRNSIGVTQIVDYLVMSKSRVIILDACRSDAPLLKQMARKAPKGALGALLSTVPRVASLLTQQVLARHPTLARQAA